MKIAIVDSTCLYNDLLQSYIDNPYNMRRMRNADLDLGGRIVFTGPYPRYEQLLSDLAKYAYKFCPDYFQLHILIGTVVPKLMPENIILGKQRLYENIIRALNHISESPFSPLSIQIHEYGTVKKKTAVINDLKHNVGRFSCDIIPCQYALIVA